MCGGPGRLVVGLERGDVVETTDSNGRAWYDMPKKAKVHKQVRTEEKTLSAGRAIKDGNDWNAAVIDIMGWMTKFNAVEIKAIEQGKPVTQALLTDVEATVAGIAGWIKNITRSGT